ncbi:hypothetical protein EPUS_08776 [Endocarpon pusillum Z07020]|uniref:Uncharacterized protein n=1 Tax=Endocarpon pusillum (strain Z07020 / HMAS-L-300199) TaxID=1263415 RepID=U1HID2_ENDPU|nr:uncharacterized protein EPUS_08776 [Endocarpon pusillum Z07020]ERF69965.1 hypothetical protein EPUS_08776 [Endocarpon pusillum Z07020]
MRRAITILFVGNAVALEHQIGGIDSYSKTTTAAFPVQIEMVQSIHDNAPPWDARAVDEEEILLSKNHLVVASPTPLVDGESGYYLKRTAETTPMSTNSAYIIEIRSDDEAGEAMLFPRQVESSASGLLRTASGLIGDEATSTINAPGNSTATPEASTDSTASTSQSPFSAMPTTSLPPIQSSVETPIATRTSPAPTSASPSSQQASTSASQSEEAPAGSTPASLSSNSETAVMSSVVESSVSSPGDQSDSPAAPSTIAIRASTTLPPSQITQPVIPLPGTTLTPNSAGQFVADNQTLVPGGSAISISGTAVSLDPSATELVVNGTSAISVIPTTVYQTPQPPTIPLAGTILTLNPASEYVAGTQTLIPGGPVITISNTAISLDLSATEIVVGNTSTVNLVPTTVYQTPQPPAIPLAGTTLTLSSVSEYVVGTQTLIPGGPVITILGTAVSLDPSATAVVVSGISTNRGASGFITRGPSGVPTRNATVTATATTIIEPYTGVASKNNIDGVGWWIFAILVVVNMFMN